MRPGLNTLQIRQFRKTIPEILGRSALQDPLEGGGAAPFGCRSGPA